ncbi:MAG: hypothetical protein QOE63_11, partial [Acidimicrobiaceae bacterium]
QPTRFAVVALLVLAACSSTGSATVTSSYSDTTTTSTSAPSAVTNVWLGTVDPTALPLGDGHRSTTTAAVGSELTCQEPRGGGGASTDGPWIHGDTWDATAKVAVQGTVSWPSASYTVTVSGAMRTIVTNDLPDHEETGTFPIAASDPAHVYDQNPNAIQEHPTTVTLPVAPTPAAGPGCLPMGPIAVLGNGVFLFNALDAPGRDAVAHETQDSCDGHPAPGDQYHYHDVPSCLRAMATGASTVVGWAYDGYPIVVERDASGALPTNADLDECHGRTSAVLIDGAAVSTYHYDATLEYPYALGCYHGKVDP